MNNLKIDISNLSGQTKVQQLVHAITENISNGQLKTGDALPSVNQLSKDTGFSRDTIFKAYNILKQRNVIESAPQKGYFVANESFKVFVLLDDFSAFKEQLYQSFRQNLPNSYSVDLLFHHYNTDVFNQLIQNSLGRYSLYVVMNINHKGIEPVLDKIDPNKLLILDMGNPQNGKMNFLLQDFNKSVFDCLEKGAEQFKKYKELNLVYEENSTPHPKETVTAVKQFCKQYNLLFRRIEKFNPQEMKIGTVYFVIRDADLVEIVKSCKAKKLEPGRDIGIISFNDTPMKQIVGGGITVISTDFNLMGKQAADFVKFKQNIHQIIPTSLILRESL